MTAGPVRVAASSSTGDIGGLSSSASAGVPRPGKLEKRAEGGSGGRNGSAE